VPEAVARRYSGQSADERSAARRDRLLDAARTLIGTQGFPASSVERICAAAKVSTRHFYELYDNKESVFLDLYERILAESLDRALASLTETAGRHMRERVPAALIAYLGPMIEDPLAARIAFVEIMGASPRLEERRLEFREGLVRLVEAEGSAAVDRGEITPRDFRFAALALTGAANAIIYDWARTPEHQDVEDLEHALAALGVTLLAD
jgi:AcrR family transcriptional regulator